MADACQSRWKAVWLTALQSLPIKRRRQGASAIRTPETLQARFGIALLLLRTPPAAGREYAQGDIVLARPRNTVSRSKRSKNLAADRGPRKALLYARVSTRDQEREGYSIPAQVKLLEDYAALNGLAIIDNHIDVETARKAGC